MRTVMRSLLLLLLVFGLGQAATRSDINTIEAAEKIRYLSQKIAKDYLHLYSRPKRTELREAIDEMLKQLEENFKAIAASTRDTNTKDLLKYLDYNKNSMQELLEKPVNKENSLLMLDYSEILLEGANSIAQEHKYKFNKEETMLMNIKRYEYLLERLGKFYMASSLGALSETNRKKMDESRQALQKGIKVIKRYSYPDDLRKQKKELERFWNSSSYILAHAYDMFIPDLVDITITYFEHLLTQFALYHSKSQ